jgi:hypothetical protein
MSHSYGAGKAMANLGAKQPHELLLMLGGLLTILLTLATRGIPGATTTGGIPQSQYSTVATDLIFNVVLGAALWVSAAITRKNLMNGAIVAGVISIILIWFGSQYPVYSHLGQIGGVVGILGAILAAAKPYLPWSESD